MEQYDLNNWWCSLTVKQKNHIASKIAGKEIGYPECTDIWESTEKERQEKIYTHCHDDHGFITQQWKEGDSFSY